MQRSRHRSLVNAALIACWVAAGLSSPALAGGWNWADEHSEITQGPEFAASKQVCRRLRNLRPPASDRPDAATLKSLADCDAAGPYYGIGQPKDFKRARQCAFAQAARHDNPDHPFGGASMLMMLYANGQGVARDLDLATALACRIDGAPAEVDGRVRHLQKLKAEHWRGHDFDYCDDITSGMAGGLCTARNADIADAKRSARLARLTRSWTPAQRRAFAPLHAAAQAYAKASSENEVDLTGTSRAAFAIDQEEHLTNAFFDLLKKLESGHQLTGSAAEYPAVDAGLNAVYQRIMAIETKPSERGVYGSKDSLPWITVTKHGIRETERVWLRYRDAWVAFAAVKYPQLAADSLRTVLTRQRIDELTPFLPRPPRKKQAAHPTVVFHALPAGAARVLEKARGIVAGGAAGAKPVFQVIFDPNAPSDAMLWRNLRKYHPDTAVRWLPVAYFGRDSGPLAATLLDAAKPAAALAANFRHYDTQKHHGGLQSKPKAALGKAQAALRKAWIRWGGYTPMLVVVAPNGRLLQTGGANAYVVDAVLARAAH